MDRVADNECQFPADARRRAEASATAIHRRDELEWTIDWMHGQQTKVVGHALNLGERGRAARFDGGSAAAMVVVDPI
jgi:hypothetical protein